MSARLAVLMAALLLALAAFLVPAPARAHAVLEGSDPADSTVVAQGPIQVELRFNETIRPVFARVLDADGKMISAPRDVSAENNVIRISLARALPAGAYMVSYRVVSADTHVVGGAFPFEVGTFSAADANSARVRFAAEQRAHFDGVPWDALIIANRAVHLAALLLASGAALFLLLVRERPEAGSGAPRDLGVLLAVCAVAGVASAVLAIGLQGGVMRAEGLESLLLRDTWRLGVASARGPSSILAIAGLALIIAGMGWTGIATKLALSVGVLAAAASLVVAGHAATVQPHWLVVPVWAVHVLVAAFWVGSLPPLLAEMRRAESRDGDDEARRAGATHALMAFSRVALPAVAVLLAAGVVMASLQLGSFQALLGSSAYAHVLLVKLALVVVLLLLAARNRFVLLPRLVATQNIAATLLVLRRIIGWEIAVGVAVIVAAAALSQQQPPTAVAATLPASTTTLEQTASDPAGNRAVIRLEPEAQGQTRMTVTFANAQGQPLAPVDVSVELSHAGTEPLLRTLARAPAGGYAYSGRDFVIPGHWSVRIEAALTDFEQSVFVTDLNIQR